MKLFNPLHERERFERHQAPALGMVYADLKKQCDAHEFKYGNRYGICTTMAHDWQLWCDCIQTPDFTKWHDPAIDGLPTIDQADDHGYVWFIRPQQGEPILKHYASPSLLKGLWMAKSKSIPPALPAIEHLEITQEVLP